MDRSVLFGVAAIVLVFAFVATQGQGEAPALEKEGFAIKDAIRTNDARAGKAKVHEMALTNDGFKPKVLTIKRGETVLFRTTRGRIFWPASNLHPTHGIYPAFDPREPIPADQTWSFTFEQVGRWDLHDHLQAHFIGSVVVTE